MSSMGIFGGNVFGAEDAQPPRPEPLPAPRPSPVPSGDKRGFTEPPFDLRQGIVFASDEVKEGILVVGMLTVPGASSSTSDVIFTTAAKAPGPMPVGTTSITQMIDKAIKDKGVALMKKDFMQTKTLVIATTKSVSAVANLAGEKGDYAVIDGFTPVLLSAQAKAHAGGGIMPLNLPTWITPVATVGGLALVGLILWKLR